MSASKSKTKETTSQQQTSSGTATTTPNTPDWLQQPWMKQASDISALQNSGQPLIAGAQPLQQQAFSAASALTGKPADDGRMVNGGPGDGYSPNGASSGFDLAQALGLRAANAPANTATAQGYSAAGPAGGQGYTAQGFNAAGAAGGQGYGASGPATAQGYTAPTLGSAAQSASRNLTDVDLAGYFNPFEQRVVDTTLADFDQNSGRVEAQQRAQQVNNGGLRNSNNAIAQAITQGELARGRASTDANLRYQGFNTATGLAQADLGRETANNQFNTSQTNAQTLAQAGLTADAARFGADASNRSALDYTGRADAASQYGASAFNQSALDLAGRQDQAGAFGASAGNAASQYGAEAFNRSALDAAGRTDQASQFGAASQNQNSMFNAGQQDNALTRMLQSAGLLSGNATAQGADTRANIGLQADLGGQQRDIANSQSPAANLALIQQLLGGIPLDQFTGRTVNQSGTGTANGATTGTASQSGFDLAKMLSPLNWSSGGGFSWGNG